MHGRLAARALRSDAAARRHPRDAAQSAARRPRRLDRRFRRASARACVRGGVRSGRQSGPRHGDRRRDPRGGLRRQQPAGERADRGDDGGAAPDRGRRRRRRRARRGPACRARPDRPRFRRRRKDDAVRTAPRGRGLHARDRGHHRAPAGTACARRRRHGREGHRDRLERRQDVARGTTVGNGADHRIRRREHAPRSTISTRVSGGAPGCRTGDDRGRRVRSQCAADRIDPQRPAGTVRPERALGPLLGAARARPRCRCARGAREPSFRDGRRCDDRRRTSRSQSRALRPGRRQRRHAILRRRPRDCCDRAHGSERPQRRPLAPRRDHAVTCAPARRSRRHRLGIQDPARGARRGADRDRRADGRGVEHPRAPACYSRGCSRPGGHRGGDDRLRPGHGCGGGDGHCRALCPATDGPFGRRRRDPDRCRRPHRGGTGTARRARRRLQARWAALLRCRTPIPARGSRDQRRSRRHSPPLAHPCAGRDGRCRSCRHDQHAGDEGHHSAAVGCSGRTRPGLLRARCL